MADTFPGNATVQHAVLAALSAVAGRCLTIEELTAAAGLGRRQVSNGMAGLIDRSYAVRRERGCYEVTEDGAAAHASGTPLTSGPTGTMERKRPVAGSLRTRLWRAMRMKKKFTLGDLLDLAMAGDERDARGNAGRYIRNLVAAGYLTELRRAKGDRHGSNGFKRYALLRDSGPRAPIARSGQTEVYDPNTATTHPCLAPDAAKGRP